jgi:hypothetical protein
MSLHVTLVVVCGHGSFALGTAIRPLSKEELDVDAACVLNISGIDQRKLKELVGDRLKEKATYERTLDPPHGGKRCWTLRYADATRFHLDVLPAVPDDSGWLVAAGVPDRFAKHALRITDTSTFDQPGYWPRSNPKGYADWFREVMVSRNRATLEKRARADVQDLPTYRRSTPLQQVIKILKRHRDAHYASHEHRPISIVITTLAAVAYEGEETVYEALRAIVTRMRRLLFVAGKHQPVLNPVNPKEDFTDKWRSIPERARVFSEWLDAIEREHDALVTPSD